MKTSTKVAVAGVGIGGTLIALGVAVHVLGGRNKDIPPKPPVEGETKGELLLEVKALSDSSIIPVSGAKVYLGGTYYGVTDSTGHRLSKNIPEGQYVVTITKTGYADKTFIVTIQGGYRNNYPTVWLSPPPVRLWSVDVPLYHTGACKEGYLHTWDVLALLRDAQNPKDPDYAYTIPDPRDINLMNISGTFRTCDGWRGLLYDLCYVKIQAQLYNGSWKDTYGPLEVHENLVAVVGNIIPTMGIMAIRMHVGEGKLAWANMSARLEWYGT